MMDALKQVVQTRARNFFEGFEKTYLDTQMWIDGKDLSLSSFVEILCVRVWGGMFFNPYLGDISLRKTYRSEYAPYFSSIVLFYVQKNKLCTDFRLLHSCLLYYIQLSLSHSWTDFLLSSSLATGREKEEEREREREREGERDMVAYLDFHFAPAFAMSIVVCVLTSSRYGM
jgi:hypothetical protein